MEKFIKLWILIFIFTEILIGQNFSETNHNSLSISYIQDSIKYMDLPERPGNALEGSEFVNQVKNYNLTDREKAVVEQILSGNVPSFSRKLKKVKFNKTISSVIYEVIFFAACDYLAIGSEEDYFYIPLTPATAQYLADRTSCTLPTKKMVDRIYNASDIKLHPQPIPPSDKMTTIPVFWDHTDSVKSQIAQLDFDRSSDNLIAGHKKDIIISNKIYSTDRNYDRVVIYGWHLGVNNPIQPVYNGHIAAYADYSHGVRLVMDTVLVNGVKYDIKDLLKDQNLALLLSDEGSIQKPYYPESDIFTSIEGKTNLKNEIRLNQNYPNPFNPSTIISYTTNEITYIDLSIYNTVGQKISTLVSQVQSAGNYKIEWYADACASGIYFCKLRAGDFEQSRKMLLLH